MNAKASRTPDERTVSEAPAAAEALADSAPAREPLRREWPELIVCGLLTLVMVISIWAVSRPTGDLYVGFAGGRDVVEGRLGENDTWCFNTTERVWINQNWGTHLAYYLVYTNFGEAGILVLKMVILLLAAGGMILAGRALGSHGSTAALAAGIVMIAAHAYIDLRPNLTSLTFTPWVLYLIYRSRLRPVRIWWAVPLVLLWANMHGGFVFGIGAVGLWTICTCAGRWVYHAGRIRGEGGLDAVRAGFTTAARENGHLLAATAAAVILPALVTPFPLENLTHFLVIGRSEVWRRVQEWHPVWWTQTAYGWPSIWIFFSYLTVFAALVVSRWVLAAAERVNRAIGLAAVWSLALCICLLLAFNDKEVVESLAEFLGTSARGSGAIAILLVVGTLVILGVRGVLMFLGSRRPEAVRFLWGGGLFNLLIAAMVIYMAMKSRRFVPLAMWGTAGMFAARMDGFLERLAIPLERARSLGLAWLLSRRSGRAELAEPPAVEYATFRRPLILLLAVVVAATASVHIRRQLMLYDPDYPFLSPYARTVYEKMVRDDMYGHAAAEFLARNDVTGRAMHEWRWEGFLQWRCPKVELFVGGRAQQVHSVEEYEWMGRTKSLLALAGRFGEAPLQRLRKALEQGVERLRSLKFDLLIFTIDDPMLGGLLDPRTRRGLSPWAAVFADPQGIVLANGETAEGRELIRRASAGALWYPDEVSRAWSRAYRMFTTRISSDPRACWRAIREALGVKTSVQLLSMLTVTAEMNSGQISLNELAAELERLAARHARNRPEDGPRLAEWLRFEQAVNRTLAQVYQGAGGGREGAAPTLRQNLLQAVQRFRAAQEDFRRLLARWQMNG